MTQYQLRKALEHNDYILVRAWDGRTMGVNCKVLNLNLKKKEYAPEFDSKFASFTRITFQEYISLKKPFL